MMLYRIHQHRDRSGASAYLRQSLCRPKIPIAVTSIYQNNSYLVETFKGCV